MESFEGVILSSWNCVVGPQIEGLWLPSNQPDVRLIEVSLSDIKEFNDSRKFSAPTGTNSRSSAGYSQCFEEELDSNSKKNSIAVVNSETSNTKNRGMLDCTAIDEPSHVAKAFPHIETFLMMSGKLLVSEVETTNPFSENASRLFCLDDKILVAVVFHKSPWLEFYMKRNEEACLCFAIMLKYEKLAFTFAVKHIIDLHLRQAALIVQRTEGSPSLVTKEVSSIIIELQEALQSLHWDNLKAIQTPSWKSHQSHQQLKFLSRAVASHIQTSCYSIVTGDSEDAVNEIVNILLLFNSEREKLCSQAIVQGTSRAYHSGLYVQGILKDNNGHKEQVLPDTVLNVSPITIIDTDGCKVRQNIYDNSLEYDRTALKTVTESGKLIPQLLHDLTFFAKHNADSSNLVKNFCKLANVKAMALVKMVENFRLLGQSPTQKELLNMLCLTEFADLQVILGYAEKLKPGIRTVL